MLLRKNALLILLFLFSTYATADNLTLESTAFKPNTMIPVAFTCNGANQSPPLNWYNVPEKTQSFALVVNDPDAPDGLWTHWILYNIPATVNKLDAGIVPSDGTVAGQNSWGSIGYRGPCPPLGVHRYSFKLYAMDKILDLKNGENRDTILQAMTGHVIDSTELIGLYQK